MVIFFTILRGGIQKFEIVAPKFGGSAVLHRNDILFNDVCDDFFELEPVQISILC